MTAVTVDAINILLVEDDEEDVMLTRRALDKANIWNKVDVVYNGQEALDYLYNRDKFADKKQYPKPGLIFLDLSLPGIDGHEVLDRIWTDEELKEIPIVIVSTSDYEKDIEFGCERGIHSYIIKPVEPDNIIAAVGRIEQFNVVLGSVT